MSLRQQARGRPCQIRVPSICNDNAETTVGCHYRMAGLSGIGSKPHDLFIAWGCSACHAYVDTHKRDEYAKLCFAEGVLRTQAILLEEDLINA